ncbi:peptidoglycan-binding domain-containing protein [Nostoc sp. CMAA1605]|uniref:peptidoglycan-binding domain-containing protein n=1 Tax=Nostoc sp. CMAA1605 TaxID=2055159 RepID=UPI001F259BB2|nr:peptidoglycan-binding protein [Nostoc sp. CMAA1605]
MVIANEEANGQAEYIDYEFPQFNWNWQKLLKSSAWLSLAGCMVFFAAITQTQSAVAAYVRTNGSCLNVRIQPEMDAKVVDCLPNGTNITSTQTVNGFVRLSANKYVSAKWVGDMSATRPNKPNNNAGVGGRVTLSLGSRGAAVAEVQKVLGINPTGYYGPVTARRVREFQGNNDLRVDGVVGPETRTALFSTASTGNMPDKPNPGTGGPVTLTLGSKGEAVSEVQKALGIEPTGYYGPVTARKVREFQANNDLRVDGVVGPETRSALLRG